MHRLRYHCLVWGIGALIAICPASGQSTATAATQGLQTHEQSDNMQTTARVRRWTKSRLEVAKKHWAENQQKFSDCSKKLDELKKTKRRLSLHRQGHFLETCMREKERSSK
jgi:hypothetical protein